MPLHVAIQYCNVILCIQEYVKNSKHPFLPIIRVAKGQYNELFESTFDDNVPVSVNYPTLVL